MVGRRSLIATGLAALAFPAAGMPEKNVNEAVALLTQRRRVLALAALVTGKDGGKYKLIVGAQTDVERNNYCGYAFFSDRNGCPEELKIPESLAGKILDMLRVEIDRRLAELGITPEQ